jgi:hypothetical protein
LISIVLTKDQKEQFKNKRTIDPDLGKDSELHNVAGGYLQEYDSKDVRNEQI